MRLTVVGCAAAWSLRSGNASSCYLVDEADAALVLDFGQGAFAALAHYRPPESLTAVLVSHLHPDHHVDLVALRHYLKFGLTPLVGGAAREPSVHLHAPPELRSRYDTFLGEEGFLDSLPGEDLREATWQVGPFSIEARRVTHALNSFAFRVSRAGTPGAPGLVYSGDCGRWQDLVPLTRAGDALLSEAFWGASPAQADEMHLLAADAGRAAAAGRAGSLILTHIAAGAEREACAEEARSTFGGPVSVAEPGLQLQIG